MASNTSFQLARTFTTFAGVDISVVFGTELIGEMQALSFAVQREKAPLYVLGRVDPLAFARGKRGIAGTLISLLLDEHILFKRFADSYFVADNSEIQPNVSNKLDVTNGSLDTVGSTVFVPNDLSQNFTVTNAWYVDQLPPIDTAIVAVNEYGSAATMRILGMEILNEGSGFSIDDTTIEDQMTYVARTILPWQRLGMWGSSGDTSLTSTSRFIPA